MSGVGEGRLSQVLWPALKVYQQIDCEHSIINWLGSVLPLGNQPKLTVFPCILVIYSGPVAESPKSSPASISALKEKIKSPFGKAKAENTRRIQLMLEETLTKNVQLQRVRNSNKRPQLCSVTPTNTVKHQFLFQLYAQTYWFIIDSYCLFRGVFFPIHVFDKWACGPNQPKFSVFF